MTPVDFYGTNAVYAKDQPEYLPLPALKTDEGVVVSCWKLSLWERVKILFTGRMWFMQHTFNDPLQPQCPSVKCPLTYKISHGQNNERISDSIT